MNAKDEVRTNTAGYYLGLIAKILLAVAMLLYLGLHSFNFFMSTFQGDQWIFAILGLFTTSIGFILWLIIYLYAAEDGLEKAVSIIMLFVSLLGEFATAGFDMYMNISDSMNMAQFTPADIRNMSYIIAGLALVNGLALVAGVAGQQIMNDFSNVKLSGRKKSNDSGNVNVSHPVTVNASETEQVTLSHLRPPHGDRQHPDLIFARIPQAMDIIQEWLDYDNKRTREIQGEERPAEIPFRKNGH